MTSTARAAIRCTAKTTTKIGALGGKCSRNQDCSTGEMQRTGLLIRKRRATAPKSAIPRSAGRVASTMECVQTDGATGMKIAA